MRLPAVRARGDDDGAILIIVLVIIAIAGLGVSATLTFTDTSLKATKALNTVQAGDQASDGAAQLAIDKMRTDLFSATGLPYDNDINESCFTDGPTHVFSVPTTSGTTPVAVYCQPAYNTGVAGAAVPITAANKPPAALMALGTDATNDGIHVTQSPTTVRTHGPVVSNSVIEVTNPNSLLYADAPVKASLGCTGKGSILPAPTCTGAAVSDPGYAPETSTVPTYQPVPTTCDANGRLVFTPGYYDNVAAMNAAVGRCSMMWFQPGIYYFDFHDGGVSHQWTISSGTVVGGALTGAGSVPGMCQSPLQSLTSNGVQFIFGGDSRLQLGSGSTFEICGIRHTSAPPIAIYGLSSGTASSTTATATVTAAASTDFTPTTGDTLATALAADKDGKYATWPPTGSTVAVGTAASITATVTPAAAVPAGSILTSAVLRVTYVNAAPSQAPTATLTLPSGTTTSVTLAKQNAKTESVDVTSALTAAVHDRGVPSATVLYKTVATGTAESVDGIYLDLTYTAPAFRGETSAAVPGNCLASGYKTGGGCAVFSTTSSYGGSMYVQGTVYTPIATADLTLKRQARVGLAVGVVTRALWINETPPFDNSPPLASIPDNTPANGGLDTVVYLAVCPAGTTTTCASFTGSNIIIRARVRLHDPGTLPTSDGQREVHVESWAVIRPGTG